MPVVLFQTTENCMAFMITYSLENNTNSICSSTSDSDVVLGGSEDPDLDVIMFSGGGGGGGAAKATNTN